MSLRLLYTFMIEDVIWSWKSDFKESRKLSKVLKLNKQAKVKFDNCK